MKIIILLTHHPTKVIMLSPEINHQIDITMRIIRHKMKMVPITEKWHSLSVTRQENEVYCCCKIDPWRKNEGMKHHVRGCLEDNSPDTAVLHFGTNNLKNNENAENIATDILNLAISVKNEKKTLVVSGITVRNDKLTHLFPIHPFSIPWKRQKTVRCTAKERIWIVCWNGNGRRKKQFLLTTQTFRSSHPQVFLKLVFHYGLNWDNLR